MSTVLFTLGEISVGTHPSLLLMTGYLKNLGNSFFPCLAENVCVFSYLRSEGFMQGACR